MNHRLTITAAVAVVLASLSLFSLIRGAGWLWAGLGAAAVVALAGTLTRLRTLPAAAGVTILTGLAAVPLFELPSWVARAGGLLLIAAAAAGGTKLRACHALATLLGYLSILLLYLNVSFASGQSFGWIVPSTASIRHLGVLAGQGFAERVYSPPVPGTHGIDVLAASGVGLIAILVDLIAVRLRHPAVAGLPLLVLFSTPITTAAKGYGPGQAIAFCLGITGYLALLAVDGRDRLRIWGRLVTAWQPNADADPGRRPDTRGMAASGRRIGLAAVAIAAVLPLALPALQTHPLGGGKPSPGGGFAGGRPQLPQPLVQMRRDLQRARPQPVLRYTTTAAHPGQQYLQVYALNYNSSTGDWILPQLSSHPINSGAALLPAPGLDAGTTTTTSRTSVTIGQLSTAGASFLPVPYAAEYLRVPGVGWDESTGTLMVYSGQRLAGLKYAVTSKTAEPSASQLGDESAIPASIKHSYLPFTGPSRARLLSIAERITRHAKTPFEKAIALQNWFTKPGNFAYSVHSKVPISAQGLVAFLTTQRRGYCQQFAIAMAVLARLVGIPSRVAVGYTAGTRQADGRWLVTTADAHAWPELYFPGAGWLRFEPTPGGVGAQSTATTPSYARTTSRNSAPSGNSGGSPQSGLPSTKPGRGAGLNHRITSPVGAGTGGAGNPAHGPGFPALPVAGGIIVLLLIVPGLARLATRRRRWRRAADPASLAHAAWRELTDDLADHGLRYRASESPRAVAWRIGTVISLDTRASEALRRVAAAEERARYALTPGPGDSLRADVLTVRRALGRASGPVQRWRARLLPGSMLIPVRSAAGNAVDVVGRMDAAALKLRGRLHPGGPGGLDGLGRLGGHGRTGGHGRPDARVPSAAPGQADDWSQTAARD